MEAGMIRMCSGITYGLPRGASLHAVSAVPHRACPRPTLPFVLSQMFYPSLNAIAALRGNFIGSFFSNRNVIYRLSSKGSR